MTISTKAGRPTRAELAVTRVMIAVATAVSPAEI
jgi:hypothetical protein